MLRSKRSPESIKDQPVKLGPENRQWWYLGHGVSNSSSCNTRQPQMTPFHHIVRSRWVLLKVILLNKEQTNQSYASTKSHIHRNRNFSSQLVVLLKDGLRIQPFTQTSLFVGSPTSSLFQRRSRMVHASLLPVMWKLTSFQYPHYLISHARGKPFENHCNDHYLVIFFI